MASFKPLNIESDDDTDDEVDNTKEIQIEEALKNYQTALKYHSEGAAHLKAAEQAYEALFESEIFKYPESQSEYNKVEALGDSQNAGIQFLPEPDEKALNTDTAPSTLPQILHLSYKNRGEFHLDVLKDKLSTAENRQQTLKANTLKALADFAEALDKDEADLDLWRRTARVGRARGSERISRYCLEAVLEGDEEGTDDVLGIPGVEVNFASQELKKSQLALDDDLSLHQTPLLDKLSDLPSIWKKQLNLYSFLPEGSSHPRILAVEATTDNEERIRLLVNEASWAAVGSAILQQLRFEQDGECENAKGIAIDIVTPEQTTVSPVTTDNLGNGESNTKTPEASVPEVKAEVKAEVKTIEDVDNVTAIEKTATKSLSNSDTKNVDTEQNQTNENATPSKPSGLVRKRSADTADLPENAEEGRGRSKRIRARQSIAMEAAQAAASNTADPTIAFDETIWENIEADEALFDKLAALTTKLGGRFRYNSKKLRNLIRPEPVEDDETPLPMYLTFKDFYETIQSWSGEKTKLLSQRETKLDNSIEARMASLASFFENTSREFQPNSEQNVSGGIKRFVDMVNNSWLNTIEVAVLWLSRTIMVAPSEDNLPAYSTYKSFAWSKDLKKVVTDLSISIDDTFRQYVATLMFSAFSQTQSSHKCAAYKRRLAMVEFSQCMLELHLEIYSKMVGPFSNLDEDIRQSQKSRLDNWLSLSREGISMLEAHPFSKGDTCLLALRHFWAMTLYLQSSGDVCREHLISCITELRNAFIAAGHPEIHIVNNSLMPELSVAAADRGISKIETMDFFLNIFHKDQASPVDLIEALEPIMQAALDKTEPTVDDTPVDARNHSLPSNGTFKDVDEPTTLRSSTNDVLNKFLQRAQISLQLSLWRRLLDAYESIDHPPKILSILLKIIGLELEQLKNTKFKELSKSERQNLILNTLRDVGYSMKHIVDLTTANSNIFEYLDLDQLKSAIYTILDLFTILYSVALFDDYSQIGDKGGTNVNPFRFYPQEVFHNASVRFHDLQIRTALVLCKLFVEGISQLPTEFGDFWAEKVDLLRTFHRFFGVRMICKAADSLLLRFMMDELLTLPKLDEKSSNDLAQILFDLYDLNCFPSAHDGADHGSDADYLDRKTAFRLIEFVFSKAQEASIKDLLKSDIGKAVEKLNNALGAIKSTTAASRNRTILDAYLKTPLNPLQIWRSFKGVGAVSITPVNPEEVPIAHTGWFFLRAQVAIAKYRAQRAKGTTVGETDDLDSAISLLMQDLQSRADRWETWYYLAQAHDCLLDEHVLWSAEKLNAERELLRNEQRATVHSYSLALAAAMRDLEFEDGDLQKIAELYSAFASRMYSSSRQPFSMGAFSTDDLPYRHYSPANATVGPYKGSSFRGFTEVDALKTACSLFRKASSLRPNLWMNHYMVGKSLWKLLRHSREYENLTDTPQASPMAIIDSIFEALFQSVDCLPERKDSNKQDPILEPIFKVIVFAHKLVQGKHIDIEVGAKYIADVLQKQNQFDPSKSPAFSADNSWTDHMVDILKFVRSVDKSRWHHRLVYRIAKILHDRGIESNNREAGAREAKDYLVDQHLYSVKTLALAVWKPEHERPGRHWIYMTRYAKFLAALLEDTKDLEAIQMMARRIRKKSSEYFEHTELWQSICEVHVRLHRQHAKVEPDLLESVFGKLDQEEFGARATLVDGWIRSPDNSNVLLDVLREAVELKKLNAGLWKGAALDSLIGDTYGQIWKMVGPSLDFASRPSRAETPARAATPVAAPTPSSADRRGVMSLTSMMNVDGNDSPKPAKEILTAPTTGTIEPPTASVEMTVRPRSRLISRREVLKRATDSVTTKPQPKRSSPQPDVPAPVPNAVLRVIAESHDISTSSNAPTVASTVVSSAPGSVNDDADDESELTQPEDDDDDAIETAAPATHRPMFPNLRAQTSSPLSETPLDLDDDDEDMLDVGSEGQTALGEGEELDEEPDEDKNEEEDGSETHAYD